MCQWGSHKLVMVKMPAELSQSGKERLALKNIDSCIADIVHALNVAGIQTATSCCGHHRSNGVIDLQDGRQIVVKE